MLAARDNIKDRLLFKLMADQCQSEVFVTRLCKMPKRVSCRKGYRRINYIDTDEIPGLLLLLKIISSPRAANISFLLVDISTSFGEVLYANVSKPEVRSNKPIRMDNHNTKNVISDG